MTTKCKRHIKPVVGKLYKLTTLATLFPVVYEQGLQLGNAGKWPVLTPNVIFMYLGEEAGKYLVLVEDKTWWLGSLPEDSWERVL